MRVTKGGHFWPVILDVGDSTKQRSLRPSPSRWRERSVQECNDHVPKAKACRHQFVMPDQTTVTLGLLKGGEMFYGEVAFSLF